MEGMTPWSLTQGTKLVFSHTFLESGSQKSTVEQSINYLKGKKSYMAVGWIRLVVWVRRSVGGFDTVIRLDPLGRGVFSVFQC